jgi:hypothetical protein
MTFTLKGQKVKKWSTPKIYEKGGFYMNLPDSDIFIVLSKFYVRHLLTKITEPQYVSTKESQNYNICLYLHAQFVYMQ